jgi:branched-chain amino acid transport system substrate-binding protein
MAALMVAAMFAGCGNSAEAGNDAVVRIGTTGPLTGPAAQYGIAVEAGMKIAVEEINALGGLQLEFKAQDDEADGEKAVAGYNNLKDWGMDVFGGSVTSGAAAAVSAEAVADQMFMLTPSASAVEVAQAGNNVFQMCFTDPNQGASAAELMAQEWPAAKIGVIYDSSDAYSAGIYNGFMAKAKELGLEVVAETAFTADTKADLSTQVTQCQDAGADMIFMPFYYTEASQAITYANKIGYKPTFFGCDGMDGILAVEGFDTSLAEGLVLMTPFDPNATDDATVSFVTKYKDQNGGQIPNQFAADGYDVVYAIYAALTDAGLDGTASSEDICAALVKWFNETEGFNGLTGKGMTWDESGMISKTPAAVVITNGIYVPMG